MQKTTITEEYRKQQQALHLNPDYGVASLGFAPVVAQMLRQFNIKSISDYGAGKQNLRKGLLDLGVSKFEYFPYDPAFPDYGDPKPADLVCCIDVLEHIEPHLIDNVLDELSRITERFGFFTIHMKPAAKTLPDGRNAHLIQQPSSWWLTRLSKRFEVRHLETLEQAYGFWVLVEPRMHSKPMDMDQPVGEEVFEEAKTLFFDGLAQMERGEAKRAEIKFRASLGLMPGRPATLTNLSSALLSQQRYDEALEVATEAFEADPSNAESCLNIAVAHEKSRRMLEAKKWYDKVLEIDPKHSAAWSNLGSLLDDQGKCLEALPCYDKALQFDPNNAEAWINRGATYMHLKRFDESLTAYENAIRLAPDKPEVHYNKGMLHLALAQFEQGWPLYEYRWKVPSSRSVPIQTTKPKWNGKKSERVLLWGEQGVGDHVFYCSLLKDLQSRVSKLTVSVDPRLFELLRRSFPRVEFVKHGNQIDQSKIDSQLSMGSVCAVLRPTQDEFITQQPKYLQADSARSAEIKRRLGKDGRRICGISWVSKNEVMGAFKTIALTGLIGLLSLEGYVFVDLQYGNTSRERAELEASTGIMVHRLEDIDTFNDLDGLAALIEACDLVVTVSNTTTHLAGALGKPTLLMVPYSVGKIWYWHENQDRSIWYPSVQIFRQQAMGDWSGPIEAIKQEMLRFARAH
jgi:tetratricopeptide (TPR) repeat protein